MYTNKWINSYDIETYVDENGYHCAYCVCLYFKNNFKSFYINNLLNSNNVLYESIEYLFQNTKKNEINTIFVHNINFDGLLLISYLSLQEKKKFKILAKNMNIYYIRISEETKIIEFRCSYKLLPLSLKKIAFNFKLLPKLPFPYKLAIKENLFLQLEVFPSFFESESEYQNFKFLWKKKKIDFKKYTLIYCKRDVRIVKDFISELYKIPLLKKINTYSIYSAPSMSINIFFSNFNNNKISSKLPLYIDRLIRPSYFGGRCEVFGNPKDNEKIFHYDFSGMYGQCMQEKFAYGKYIVNSDIILNPDKFSFSKPGYYSIDFHSKSDNYLPLLPHKNFSNNKLMFTNGEISGVYWFEEILFFLECELGIISRINYSITFTSYDYVFNDFVDFFSKLRKKNQAYNVFGKLMINSLYGRMGMSTDDNKTFFITKKELNLIENKSKIISIKELNNIYLVEVEINNFIKKYLNESFKENKSNIAIASAITAKSRIKLYKAYQNVIINNGRILYSDTDSIFAAYLKDVSNCKHGEIFWDTSKNDTIIKDAVFINPKSYAIQYPDNSEIIKIKGINLINSTFETIKKNFYDNKASILFENLTEIQKKNLKLISIYTNKEIYINKYDKRKFIDKKKNTAPYYFRKMLYQ